MKKILFGFWAVLMALVSCTDQDEVEIAYQSTTRVTASHLFDGYEFYRETDGDMATHGWLLNIRVLTYDETGNLVAKSEKQYNTMNAELVYDTYLVPGKYTIVGIADFSSRNDAEFRFWNIQNEQRLADLTITENENTYTQPFETLGIATTEITVTDKVQFAGLDIRPVTSLVEIFMRDKDYSGFGMHGYSVYAPGIYYYDIIAPRIKTEVRFENGQPVYPYDEQVSNETLARSFPYDKWAEQTVATSYAYRALLPETDKSFRWNAVLHGYFEEWKNFCGEFDTSGQSDALTLESGQQYVLNMILDDLALVLSPYDNTVTQDAYLENYMEEVNKAGILTMLDFGYENLVGLPEYILSSYMLTEPYEYNETGTVARYPHSPAKNFENFVAVRYTDSTRSEANRIMLTLPKMSDVLVDYLVEQLGERFTSLEQTGEVYQFIDGASVDDADCGITLAVGSQPDSPAGSNDNISLYFDKIH